MSHSSKPFRPFEADSGAEIDGPLIDSVLVSLGTVLERTLQTGEPGALDLRSLPQMGEATYRSLREALGTGEVAATVECESRVEIRETQYPGVWWISHLNERGGTVTELIEITEIPAILKSNLLDMRTGLGRLRDALAESDRARARPTDGEPHRTERTGDRIGVPRHPDEEAAL